MAMLSDPATLGSPQRSAQDTVLLDQWKRTLRIATKTALVAALIRLAFGVVKSLLKSKLAPALLLRLLRDEFFSLNPAKWAVVFAGWSCYPALKATFEALLCIPSNKRTTKTLDSPIPASPGLDLLPLVDEGESAEEAQIDYRAKERIASLAAGAVAGLPILVMEVSTRTELGLYLFIRAAHGILSTYLFPVLPGVLQKFQHWDVAGVGFAGAPILYAIMFQPDCHSVAYESFLERCTLLSRSVLDGMACHHRSHWSPSIVADCLKKGIQLPDDLSKPMPPGFVCKFVHPNRSCNQHFFMWIAKHLATFSGPLYLPLKIVMSVTMHPKQLVKDPAGSLVRMLKSVLYSSLFLTLYCALPYRMVCVLHQNGIRSGFTVAIFSGLLCCLSTLFEPKSRRLDLALYCLMHALRFMRLLLYQRGWLDRPTRGQVMAMYLAATSIIFYQWDHTRDNLHPNMKKGLAMVLGEKMK